MIMQIIYAGAVTLGFSFLFNIKGKNLFYASLGGSLGWWVYLLAKKVPCSEYLSFFLASVTIGVYSEIGARKLKTPVTTLLIAALIPLAPGGGIYKTMVSLINEKFFEAAEYGIVTFGIAGSIAMGILIVSTFFQIYSNVKRGSIKLWIFFAKGRRRKCSKNS